MNTEMSEGNGGFNEHWHFRRMLSQSWRIIISPKLIAQMSYCSCVSCVNISNLIPINTCNLFILRLYFFSFLLCWLHFHLSLNVNTVSPPLYKGHLFLRTSIFYPKYFLFILFKLVYKGHLPMKATLTGSIGWSIRDMFDCTCIMLLHCSLSVVDCSIQYM